MSHPPAPFTDAEARVFMAAYIRGRKRGLDRKGAHNAALNLVYKARAAKRKDAA